MNLPRYEEHEKEFLEAMATNFCFTGKTRIVFLQRFSEENVQFIDRTLADEWQRELLEGTKKAETNFAAAKKAEENLAVAKKAGNLEATKKAEENLAVAKKKIVDAAAIVLRDHLEIICDKLEDEGCDFKTIIKGQEVAITKGRWKIGKAWLQKVKFPKWAKERGLIAETLLTLEQLWNQLKLKATPTDKMGPKLAAISTLEMYEQPSNYLQTVKLGSHIQFHLELETTGHLILLEKGTSGRLWCLCPSFFAPKSYLNSEKMVLPQEKSPQKSFKVSGVPGIEEIVAIIAATSPPFPWLPKSDQNPLQLQEPHLQELLGYFEGRLESSILYMDYAVAAS